MRASTDRIITSHAGSLPRPDDLIEANRARDQVRRSTRTTSNRSYVRQWVTSCGARETLASTCRGTASSANQWGSASIMGRGAAIRSTVWVASVRRTQLV